MGSPLYATQIMAALADRLHTAAPALTHTPFGVSLEPAWGIYAAGQRVSAPGLDDCSPRQECEVAAVGRRPDHPGVWYLLRCLDRHGGHALVQEDDLRPLGDARVERAVASAGSRTRMVRPATFREPAVVMRSQDRPRVAAHR